MHAELNSSMKKSSSLLLIIILGFSLFSCHIKRHADTLFFNGKVYTIDNGFSIVEAFAVNNGKIVGLGSSEDILHEFVTSESVDLKGKYVYPGFIDAHCHFYGYSTDLLKCDLYGTTSFEEVIQRMIDFSKTNKFKWNLGRGWDQNDWTLKEFPSNEKLDSLFPTKPVFLMRIDGHAALCNSAALKLANINSSTKITGGEVMMKDGKLTGLLIDNAVDLVKNKIPPFSNDLIEESLLKGQENCFAVGLTTVDDAGLGKDSIFTIHKLQKEGRMRMRVYAMMSDEPSTVKHFIEHGPYKNDFLEVRAIKVYADGALGSRGACLKKEYTDQKNHYGYMLHTPEYFTEIADEAIENGFQLCTHAIGDSANKVILDLYKSHLSGENNRRWRIEHCQVVDPKDRQKYGNNNIIPSVQPTHATSDMYWAEERLGKERMTNAYAYKSLRDDSNGMIVFGTDFPVEDISPIKTFYAAVYRRDLAGFPPEGFQIEEKTKRKDAIRAMTIWAAFSNFQEEEKGSLEEGKFADFVILDNDLMKMDESKIPSTKVIATFIDGKKVYQQK